VDVGEELGGGGDAATDETLTISSSLPTFSSKAAIVVCAWDVEFGGYGLIRMRSPADRSASLNIALNHR